ncbi:MAG: Mut7-C RNAse domain-containing protein [Aquificaceae bacterium]|nr:Mut7-C RNAse domain-containing protein [Aquificaceae bacterium]MCS7195683.1 Mut7-C RNAse domain-containing protein [Aquificaceae bacterium]MDW8033102.1 Mut7-C RNAse domain-containing protein [Aquificaceae bacterium]MDW8294805.1 Mut7-C RNAse domain-containing protein [Aquificaceae bacterium]
MRGFLLEADLHRLAYWLRLLGQDALLLEGPINKAEVVKYPDRVFITTSRKLEEHFKAWGIRYLIIPRDQWKVQLCLLIKHFKIEPLLRLNRCYHCNAELRVVNREEVKERIPPAVYLFGKDFTMCPVCGKIYWKGSHHKALNRKLKEIKSAC